MILVSHPTGNTFVRALLARLESEGLLHSFWTTLALHADDRALQLLSAGARAQAARRGYDIPSEKLRRFPAREALRHLAPKIGLGRLSRHERGPASLDAVYRDLDRRVASQLLRGQSNAPTGVYAYEDGALRTFEAAQRAGVRRVYDLPIAYWRPARVY